MTAAAKASDATGGPTGYVCKLTPAQARQLRDILEPRGWKFDACPYAFWRAADGATKVIAYESGKLVVQGKGTPEFVRYTLEPEILGEARYGYEKVLVEVEHPEMFKPHAGIDESGKGDYFGPLVTAAVYVTGYTARQLLEMGVKDSKVIKNDRRIHELAEKIKVTVQGNFSVVTIGPEAYNRLYETMGNVNRMLAWGHARSLENLLDKVPDCPRAISDQFAHKQTVIKALLGKGKKITLEQRPRAEADVAVAAASILARTDFVRRLERMSLELGFKVPKGAGVNVIEAAAEMVRKAGPDKLRQYCKLHFKTTEKVMHEG